LYHSTLGLRVIKKKKTAWMTLPLGEMPGKYQILLLLLLYSRYRS